MSGAARNAGARRTSMSSGGSLPSKADFNSKAVIDAFMVYLPSSNAIFDLLDDRVVSRHTFNKVTVGTNIRALPLLRSMLHKDSETEVRASSVPSVLIA